MFEHGAAQNTEAWEQARLGCATASQFNRIVTPAKNSLAKGRETYAHELVAERLGIHTPKPMPSFWMDRGTELEPEARSCYGFSHGGEIRTPGLIYGDESRTWGGSPDALVDDDGLLEIKCPKPETHIKTMLTKQVPSQYIPQVRGLMMVCDRAWCDFYSYHPELAPVKIRVERCDAWESSFADHLFTFLEEVETMRKAVLHGG